MFNILFVDSLRAEKMPRKRSTTTITTRLPQVGGVPVEDVDRLNDYLTAAVEEGGREARGEAMGVLIRAAFAFFRQATDLAELTDLTRRVRATIRELLDIDTTEQPCPARVDPRWWAEKQRQEREQTQEAFRRALQEADDLSRQLHELARRMREGS